MYLTLATPVVGFALLLVLQRLETALFDGVKD